MVKLLRLRRTGIFYTKARALPDSTSKLIFLLFKFNFIVMLSFMVFKLNIYLNFRYRFDGVLYNIRCFRMFQL